MTNLNEKALDILVGRDGDTGKVMCMVCSKLYAHKGPCKNHIKAEHPKEIDDLAKNLDREILHRHIEWDIKHTSELLNRTIEEYEKCQEEFIERIHREGISETAAWRLTNAVEVETAAKEAKRILPFWTKCRNAGDYNGFYLGISDRINDIKDKLVSRPFRPSSS